MTAKEVAVALNGRPVGHHYLCRCPVPGHGQGRGDRHPSLLVRDGDATGRLLVHCFAGCDPRDVLEELRREGLIEEGLKTAPVRRSARPWTVAPAEPTHEPDATALALWRRARPATGTLIETYLKRRGIRIAIPPSIRFSTVLHYGRVEVPTMIAAVQRPRDGRVMAVQRTALTWAGTKTSTSTPRVTMGALGYGAVRLAKATYVLGLAEGVEDALAAIQVSGLPCWVALGAGRLHRVAVPSTVRELHVFADDDEAGRIAAERAAARHCAEGRRVVLRFPPTGIKDYADIVAAAEGAAA
jgi:putative DNA primase/helicase